MVDIKQAGQTPQKEELDIKETYGALSEFEIFHKEDAFRQIVEEAYEGIAIARGDKFCYVNKRMAELTGHTREELLTISFIEIIHPDDRAMAIDLYTRRLKGEDVHTTYPIRLTTKDGETKWVQITANMIKWKGQAAVLGLITDISLQKKFEESLQQSEKKYRRIVSNSILGIYETNLEGKILYMNDAMLNIFEWDSPQGVIGEDVVKIYKSKKHRDNYLKILKKNGHVENFELDLITTNGKFKHVLVTATLSGDNISGTLMDITDRKKAEIAMLESRNMLNALINSTEDDIVLLIDPDGKVISVNETAAKIYGSAPEKIIGRNVYEVMPPEVASRRKTIAIDAIETKKPVHYMEERLGRFYKCSVYPIFYDQDNIRSLAIFARDVTELKLTEKELQEAKKNLEYRVKRRTEELERKSQYLEEANIALRVLLERRNEDKNEMEEKILTNVRELVVPYLEKVKRKVTDKKLQSYIAILDANLSNIVSPFSNKLSSKYMNLTSAEIEVADLVKHGKSTKEIADLLNVSIKTVETHRVNMRKKLGITNKKANLRTYLLSLM